ncbi:DegT/DnrJ/EryC1/StrS aminotransferase family protein [Glaciecola sp. KUL10]|uniref:DegT/DnrJ/EryC1/StrS family aminotransferase n=1 Tax=Glaciecola sp. (strain KUL10) TaxID=2161813 RepID=UPI000D78B5A8|nr:DegT/DnrJ/EryC1/StrS family aminotransferase [Glaciecola sp. KUL10]GBL04001.1 aminotransferase, DegT/DnrJ/EryC1/StrS family protein [Glaciecola sp. KUL10]
MALSKQRVLPEYRSIPLNKPYLPNKQKYFRQIEKMYDNVWLTNHGPLLQEFCERLSAYLGVPYIVPTSSCTAALQLAYKLFDLKGNVVSTPYSFVATSSSINWVNLDVNFADIDSKSLNISPEMIEKAIDNKTSAIVPVHVYGNPCETQKIAAIAKQHNLKVIYDAAHAFGITKDNRSILLEGDASAISFHATKLFHSIEGGALILSNKQDYERAMQMINFGIDSSNGSIVSSGFNGKMSEAHAAMGIAMLDEIDSVIERRQMLYSEYKRQLGHLIDYPEWSKDASNNAAYFPILLKSKSKTEKLLKSLNMHGVQARRYFSPSLNTIPAFSASKRVLCPVSERTSKRVLCLPLYYALEKVDVKYICDIVKTVANTVKS